MNRVTYLRVVVRVMRLHAYCFHCDNWFTRLRWECSEERRRLYADRIAIAAKRATP